MRDIAKQLAKRLPKTWERRAARVEEYTRLLWQGGAWFEELGFYYVGPIDGHDLDQLVPVLKNVRDAKQRTDPRSRGDQEGQGISAG